MEEKYSFYEKKLALEKYIKNQNKKNHSIQQLKNLKIKTKSEECLFCNNQIVNENLFCSRICKTIFYSNIQRLIPNSYNQVRFIPFELLSESAKKRFREFVQVKRIYDKFQSRYSYIIKENQQYILATFKFIYKFEIQEIMESEFQLNYFYAPTEEPITYISLENSYKDIFIKRCLFCKCETDNFVIRINKRFVTGYVCSIFCFKSFMTFIETHINHPYKYFFSLPYLPLLVNPSPILKYKDNIKCQNIVFETEYYDNNENHFNVNIITY